MLADTRQLVHATWALAQPAADRLTHDFYTHLFEIDPGAARLFAATEMDAQRRKFCDMLDAITHSRDLS